MRNRVSESSFAVSTRSPRFSALLRLTSANRVCIMKWLSAARAAPLPETEPGRLFLKPDAKKEKETGVMLITKAPKGTRDMLPEEGNRWHHMENIMRAVCALYGYREVRIPSLSIPSFFCAAWAAPPISCRRRCTHSWTRAAAASRSSPRARPAWHGASWKTASTPGRCPLRCTICIRRYFDTSGRRPDGCGNTTSLAWRCSGRPSRRPTPR